MVGATLLTVTTTSSEPALPAASVTVKRKVYVPSSLGVKLKSGLLPSAIAWPLVLLSRCQVEAGVPLLLGVSVKLPLSVTEAPSLTVWSVPAWTVGGVVSIVTDRADEATLVFPASSVAMAVMLWVPSLRVSTLILQTPASSATSLPTATPWL